MHEVSIALAARPLHKKRLVAAALERAFLQPGDLLAGKYRVERVLGEGGMGVVLAATHLHLDQLVAVKVLLAERCDSPGAATRFLREARAAAQIKSEHVTRVSDVGLLNSGEPYMVMEFLEGADLCAVVDSRGALPVAEAIDYLLQACEALAEAHSLGIVHRDLKPSNLFLTQRADGSHLVKVLDFGISKLGPSPDVADVSLTSPDALLGSPAYMAPEQVRNTKDVDARADIWALGVILYELITGHQPFDDDTISGVLAQVVADEPPPLRAYRPDVPDDVADAVHRCLVKDRDQRFQTIAELAESLAAAAPVGARTSVERISRVLTPGRLPAPVASPSRPRVASAEAKTMAAWGTDGSEQVSRRRWSVFAGAVLLVLAGTGIGIFLSGGGHDAGDSGGAASRPMNPVPLPATRSAPQSAPAPVTSPTSANAPPQNASDVPAVAPVIEAKSPPRAARAKTAATKTTTKTADKARGAVVVDPLDGRH